MKPLLLLPPALLAILGYYLWYKGDYGLALIAFLAGLMSVRLVLDSYLEGIPVLVALLAYAIFSALIAPLFIIVYLLVEMLIR